MATLISQIIVDAYREGNLTSISGALTSAEQTEGLRLLNRFISSLFGNDLGDPLTDYPVGRGTGIDTPNYNTVYLDELPGFYVPKNTRMQCNLTQATTLDIDPNPSDGARLAVVDNAGNFNTYNLILKGNGRKIESSTSVTLNAASTQREWFYRADTGTWNKLASLVAGDNSPFPEAFDDLLSIGLAMRLMPRNGPPLRAESMAVFKDLSQKFKARYTQKSEQVSEAGIVKLPSMRRYQGAWGTSLDRFQRGL